MMAAAAAARQVCGTVLFWPLFGNSFYFPFGEEERLLLKTTISIIMLFSLTRKCPVTLCLSEKGFFLLFIFPGSCATLVPHKKEQEKKAISVFFSKGC